MRLILSITLTAFILCTGALTGGLSAQTSKKAGAKAGGKPTAAQLAQGKLLVSKSDCLNCHRLDVKLIGPAYKDVAAKYPATEANYKLLSQKVISGGSGVWGPNAMAPHPAILPADIRKMVQYVLSVK